MLFTQNVPIHYFRLYCISWQKKRPVISFFLSFCTKESNNNRPISLMSSSRKVNGTFKQCYLFPRLISKSNQVKYQLLIPNLLWIVVCIYSVDGGSSNDLRVRKRFSISEKMSVWEN